MPYINVNDVYIMDNTGKQVDDAVDYALANSNRNLLDNPWWGSGEVVNQRSFSSGSTAHNVYCIDRWKTSYGSATGTISLGANGLTITAASGTYALINQVIDNYTKLTGKTVTCSAMLSNGTVISGTIANLNWDASPVAVTSGNVRLQMLGQGYFRVTILNGGSATIRAVKLELGSYSTLANDVPPNYGEELRKCMYYCRVIQGASFIAVGQAVASTVIRFPLPYVMRARPTATLTGTAQVYGQGGPLTPSALSCTGNTTQGIEISATVSGATSGQSYMLVFSGANDKIVISADL